jgi:hypothetical protein
MVQPPVIQVEEVGVTMVEAEVAMAVVEVALPSRIIYLFFLGKSPWATIRLIHIQHHAPTLRIMSQVWPWADMARILIQEVQAVRVALV